MRRFLASLVTLTLLASTVTPVLAQAPAQGTL